MWERSHFGRPRPLHRICKRHSLLVMDGWGGMKEIKLLACCILFRQWYITPACSYKMRQASLEDWEEKEAKPTILHLHLHCLCISKALDLNIRPDIDDGFSFTFSLNMHKKTCLQKKKGPFSQRIQTSLERILMRNFQRQDILEAQFSQRLLNSKRLP